MLRVGITGGIGSGKTALTDWLTTQGIVIVDADLAARIVVEPGQPALTEIAETFGGKFIQCCFYDNKLFMMIPVEKDLFETGSIYEAEDFIDDSKSLLKELSLIFSIIDTLKLNMKINL